MANERPGGPGFTGNNFILLLIAAAGAAYVALQKPPLEGLRPESVALSTHDTGNIQDVEDRLWQDPLAAVAQVKKETGDMHRLATFRSRYLKTTNLPLVIGVTIPGAPYSEDAESRRRYRYALLAALNTAKYVPDDGEHIGYMRIEEPVAAEPANNKPAGSRSVRTSASANKVASGSDPNHDNKPAPPLPSIIPFESFSSVKLPVRQIVILWLDENLLGSQRRPLLSIGYLLCQLYPEKVSRFVLLGPQASTTLTAMVGEISEHNGRIPSRLQPTPCAGEPITALAGVSIYNFGATADNATVAEGAKLPSAVNVADEFTRIGIRYERVISSDRQLAHLLVQELKQRRVQPTSLDQTKSVPVSRNEQAMLHLT